MKPNPHPVPSSVRKRFFDTFNRRETSNDLGITESGSRWDAIRGIFRISGRRAFAVSDNSEYPIATVTMPYEDVEISVDQIENGSGVALWVTDSGNWWGLGLEQEEIDCNCSVGTECNRWNQGGLCDRWNVGNCRRWNSRNCREEACGAWNANNCTSFNAAVWSCTTTYPCVSWTKFCSRWINFGPESSPFCSSWSTVCANYRPTTNCVQNASSNCRTWSGSNCSRFDCVRWNSRNCNRWNTGSCNKWTIETCNRWNEFTFNCQTCYPQWIRLIQSVNSTVTTVARFLITKTFRSESSPQGGLTLFFQDTFLNKVIEGIKVFVKGKDITADLYHENNFLDKVDVEEQIVYTATGAETTASYGILVIPSQYNQNNIIGPIEIKKNN